MFKTRRLELLPHPSQKADAPRAQLHATLVINGSDLSAEFEYVNDPNESSALVIPALHEGSPSRKDNLWQATCFELFLQPESRNNYWEINFSPRGDWNIYAFDGYREGMKNETRLGAVQLNELQAEEKRCVCKFNVSLLGLALRHFEMRIGLTAVIQTSDGKKTYWALKHASEKPDFHKPESFTFHAMIGS
jgi:hypothetical protein